MPSANDGQPHPEPDSSFLYFRIPPGKKQAWMAAAQAAKMDFEKWILYSLDRQAVADLSS